MRELGIAYGNSSHAKTWVNKMTSFNALAERLGQTVRTTETVSEYRKMGKADKERAKDHGGFVGGHLRDNRRRRENVAFRSMLTPDIDHAEPDFPERFRAAFHHEAVVYGTHGYTPEEPRLRIIIPLARDVTPDEYVAIMRFFAAQWGIDQFDECSYRVNQLMYWPTTPADGQYLFFHTDGEWMDPDDILAAHPNWRDFSLLPTSSRESTVRRPDGRKMEDPLEKPGVIGAFCRAYSVEEAIETFLPDVYAPSASEGRYDYIPADSSAGVVIYDGKFAYSHHATDPVCGKLLNAFDLVRLHKYRDLDDRASADTPVGKLPSFKAMQEFALKDEQVKGILIQDRIAEAAEMFDEDDSEWMSNLELEKNGTVKNTLRNLILIMQNDESLKNIVFNQLADGMEITGPVPWQHPAKFWRDADDAQLVSYVDTRYGTFSARNYDIAVTKVADDRSYHPIREMFEALPEWDGVRRVDTVLIDYLGAQDNEYVRAVTRKILCAAYTRVYQPGVKFDYIVVLNGDQGIGKSTLIANLGMEWFSDSLALSDMNDKTAAEKLQGYWILEIGELAGMKKADIDKVKAFISRQDDKYRASFGRRVTPHPRQCVFFGTTNSENGYLRDITGNRRFWSVKVSGHGKYKPWELDAETSKQIWAETILYSKAGEKLYLPAELEGYAKNEQRDAMERDDREGVVREYLDMLLPVGWPEMDIYKRREYFREQDDPMRPKGTIQRETVSNIEIWSECFGKNKEDMKAADSYAISAIMVRIGGWTHNSERKRLPIYGLQRIYRRSPQ